MEDKVRYEMEFPIHASPSLLYQYIATPSGLSEWFADNVNSRGEMFTFIWDDSEEKAKLVSKRTGERVKFKWIDEEGNDSDYFFELKILEDEITKDVSILVVDFAEEDEIEESKLLWENQISDLKQVLGST
ncbi:START-like domain-containing protein [Flavobacterium sp.]|uniref:START-like domain-containing protein n=1 Tax=Flavobacterium sp. TaxID=239 RepID=UPI00352821B8